jgi:predicted RNA-binding Zn-ribbon protein involved in translation (DUF1610 family)
VITVPAPIQKAELIGAAAAAPASYATADSAAMTAPASTAGEQRQPCPECGEMIIVGAAKCRFCNAIFDPKLKQMSAGNNADLKQLAIHQRGLQLSILIFVLAYIGVCFFSANAGRRVGPSPIAMISVLVFLIAFIACLVFLVLVAAKTRSVVEAVVCGILMFLPCVNLVVLFFVNQGATKMLKERGIKVGFLGADMSQF